MTFIEDQIMEKKYRRIGWAIMHMNYLERVWWSITGKHKYMMNKYWDEQK